MPPLAREESMRQLMTLTLALLICFLGLMIMQSLDDAPPETARKSRKTTNDSKSLPTANRTISSIQSLPVELLMHIFGYLAPNNVQPHLNSVSFQAYKQAQKDLRSVCLVSKQMDAIARPYLYCAAIINNVDVLAYLLRTLDEAQALAQHVKCLVLEVPFTSENENYRKPNVAVLQSRPNYSNICDMVAEASDVTQYDRYLVGLRKALLERNWHWPGPSFMEWAWKKEYEALGLMHFEILRRTNSLRSLCFGMLCSMEAHYVVPYISLLGNVTRAIGEHQDIAPVHQFMPKLHELQLLRNDADGRRPFSAEFLRYFLGISGLRTLKTLHDDGNWYRLDPRQKPEVHMPISSRQSKNITCIDLKRSHCRPPAIFQICTIFPNLQYMSVSTDYGITAKRFGDSASHEKSLSAGLAKLEHLRELVLDLHYKDDIKPWLGPHGVLNLAGLKNLVNLRLPLYYLVEVRSDYSSFIADLGLALPPMVERLTVWADMDIVRQSMVTISHLHASQIISPYHPSQSALDFLDSVSARATDHFKALEQVTYSYRHQASSTACSCDEDVTCGRCEASQLLDPYAMDDSSAQMQILSSRFDDHGVRLRVLQEQAEN